MRAAIVGIALVIAISLASMLWELGHLDGFRAQIRSQYAANPSPGVSERAYEHSAVMILVVALLVAAVLVVAFGALVCNFLWRGRQWARVIAFICGGLGMLGGPLALVENASTGARLVQGLSALLDLGIVIALAMEDSSHFFRSRKQHKQEAWNQRLWEQREEARRAAP
ncbi:MAG: hypothetical protein ACRDP1_12865, partial [Nocardioidaceae bacterium]